MEEAWRVKGGRGEKKRRKGGEERRKRKEERRETDVKWSKW